MVQALSPRNVIVNFYDKVDKEKCEDAFNTHISERFKHKIWKGDAAYFAKGYTYTTGIKNVSTFRMSDSRTSPEVGVNYTHNLELLHHPLLDDIKTVQYKDRRQADKNIVKFNRLVIDELHGKPSKIKKIPYRLYYSENAVETILWYAEADYDRNDELFTKAPGQLQEFRRALFVKEDKIWKIDGLKYR